LSISTSSFFGFVEYPFAPQARKLFFNSVTESFSMASSDKMKALFSFVDVLASACGDAISPIAAS
jgi:hypothetical protein